MYIFIHCVEIVIVCLNMIKKRSIHNFDIDVSKNDNILTLSTCTNIGEGRIVVHAKLIK